MTFGRSFARASITAALVAIPVSCATRDAPADEEAVRDRDAPLPESTGYVAADDGTRLFYRSIGDGPQAVVIPVGFYLESALRPLARPGRRLVFYDPRGRGRSDAVDTTRVSLDHQIADLEAVRRELGLERMALIGWSGLGMELAVYAMRHPDRVSRLVQVAPVAPRQEPHNSVAYRERERRYDADRVAEYRSRRDAGQLEGDPESWCRELEAITMPANFADTTHMSAVPDVCAHPNEWPTNLGPLFSALLGSFGDYDWRDDLRELEIPRLVVHGAADAFPVEGSREWVEGVPNARWIVIPDAGHFPFLERPDLFFPAVERFLDGEWPAAAEAVPAAATADGTRGMEPEPHSPV